MADTVTILVATMSGTAEMVADELVGELEDAGREVRIIRMEKVKPSDIVADRIWLICSSTYGTGEVPDNGKEFYTALQAEHPDLSDVQYGVVALGDSIYPDTFCFGGKKFDALFESLGATRLGRRLEHDARGGIYPEDAASEWVKGWLEVIDAKNM